MSAADVRRRLRRRAGELGLEFQQALQYYAMERFLFRLSRTPWAERLIVKGAVMLRVWGAAVARPTRDIDFLGRIDNTPGAVRSAVLACLEVEADDDGIVFSKDIDVVQAMINDRYPGMRVTIRGELAGARCTLRLDIGIDDATVPEPGWVDYPTLLHTPAPRILAYDPATAIAEKFEAMVNLGLVNSRLKDFYDVWMLASVLCFDGQDLADALSATFGRRGTALPTEPPAALTNEFIAQETTSQMWHAYRARLASSGIEAPEDLAKIVGLMIDFILPPAVAAATQKPFPGRWTAASGWGSQHPHRADHDASARRQ